MFLGHRSLAAHGEEQLSSGSIDQADLEVSAK
jgi:hypothetical protein